MPRLVLALLPGPDGAARRSPGRRDGGGREDRGHRRHASAGLPHLRLTYEVRTPYGDWSLATSVVDPRGLVTVGATLAAYDDPSEGTEVQIPLVSFRLRRR